ncbi:MAG: tripartite tricarboxylate transporter substrate binding protein [Burkholderiales bacterium]|nr:tripartite tricarboxylate transporter substrate binding protein [Burkholderiales bacterium]
MTIDIPVLSCRIPAAGPLAAAVLAALAALPAAAQPAWPAKAIRILVGAPAGGSNDIFARSIGQHLNAALKQPVIVDNRPGASQMIAADLMVKSPPDGHTLYVSSTTYTTAAAIQPKLPFDPVNDVTGVTLLAKSPMVLVVHPSVPAKSAKELIALARAQPDKLNYTSSGVGSINQMGTELFLSAAKIRMVHVPHKGMSPAVTDLMAGNVQVLLVSLPSVEAQMKSGRLRAIGLSTAKRSDSAPGVPPIAETGLPGYDVSLWWGLFAPAKTPRAVVERLNAEVHKSLASAEMKKRFASFGAEAAPTTPEAFTAMIASEIGGWRKVVKEAGIKPE